MVVFWKNCEQVIYSHSLSALLAFGTCTDKEFTVWIGEKKGLFFPSVIPVRPVPMKNQYVVHSYLSHYWYKIHTVRDYSPKKSDFFVCLFSLSITSIWAVSCLIMTSTCTINLEVRAQEAKVKRHVFLYSPNSAGKHHPLLVFWVLICISLIYMLLNLTPELLNYTHFACLHSRNYLVSFILFFHQYVLVVSLHLARFADWSVLYRFTLIKKRSTFLFDQMT